mmetsp:Transcript_23056/g.55980  ORF Transcript_23056/g.55980 Transcript_23056/m.55980 type:complete len:244 (+) Transcript_23056:762-1493(+)
MVARRRFCVAVFCLAWSSACDKSCWVCTADSRTLKHCSASLRCAFIATWSSENKCMRQSTVARQSSTLAVLGACGGRSSTFEPLRSRALTGVVSLPIAEAAKGLESADRLQCSSQLPIEADKTVRGTGLNSGLSPRCMGPPQPRIADETARTSGDVRLSVSPDRSRCTCCVGAGITVPSFCPAGCPGATGNLGPRAPPDRLRPTGAARKAATGSGAAFGRAEGSGRCDACAGRTPTYMTQRQT